MSTRLPLVRQTYHIALDIETAIDYNAQESDEQAERYRRMLIEALLAHPVSLRRLSRSAAIAALKAAREMLEAEYSKGSVSEQELLAPIVVQLEPEARAYFTEEIEDHQSVFCFDGYKATIKHIQMTASDDSQ